MHVVRAKLHAERTAMTGSTVNSEEGLDRDIMLG